MIKQTKIVQISDIHIVAGPDKLHGLTPAGRLRQCIDNINANHADADLCVITGDLTDVGDLDAYVKFREIIADLKLPVQLMIGNHDNRLNFTRVFPEIQTDGNGFIQASRQLNGLSLLFLDTNEPGTHSGAYCIQRQKWLNGQLSALPDEAPVYIFLHHQPFDIHWPAMDEIGIVHAYELQDILASHRNIKYVFFGHIHRTMNGVWRGIPFTAVPANNHQIWWEHDGELDIRYTQEPSAYNVILIDDDETLVYQYPLDLSGTPVFPHSSSKVI